MSKPMLAKLFLYALYVTLIYLLTYLSLVRDPINETGSLVVPILMAGLGLGMVAQPIFDWHNTKTLRKVFSQSFMTLAGLSCIVLVIGLETMICLIIVWPILAVCLFIGLWVARGVNNSINTNYAQCVSIVVLPFAMFFVDTDHLFDPKPFAVTTQIEITGAVADVMALTANVPTISDDERPWTFTHNIAGAPRPISAEVIDGVRYAKWEKGVHFEEVMIETRTDNTLSWTFQFPDLVALGPIDYSVSPTGPDVFMDRGKYRFDPLTNGNTLVTLTTEYRLSTPMNWYYAAWGTVFLNDFHTAVLHVLAHRAEAAQN